jgi:EAL domain-containing protein (putative c-di-GMP-specific phosphodiesterase class I)
LLLLCGLTSAALAGWLWSNQLGLLHKEQLQREETQRGLLDLRITSHKITALDWGQWTPLYRFAGGEDPTFVAREVLSSSIIRDGQLLVIAGADGQLRSLPAGRLPSALKPCLRQRLAVLRRQPDLTGQSRAYGLFCRAGAAAYLGGTTAILPSAGPGRARGWLLHLSQLERPSYNAAVNLAFRTIGNTLREAPAASATPAEPAEDRAASISELLPQGSSYRLEPLHTPLELQLRAMERALLPWLGFNGLLGLAGTVGLLGLRQLRLQQLRQNRLAQSRLGGLRQRLKGPQLSQRQLRQLIERQPSALDDAWIAALRITVTMVSSRYSRSNAQSLCLQRLAERLQQLPGNRWLALGEDSQLLWVFRPDPQEQEPQQQVLTLLRGLQTELAGSIKLELRGVLGPLEPLALAQQLADLTLVLTALESSPAVVQTWPEGLASEAQRLRERQQLDFNVNLLVENLQAHRYRLEPVVDLSGQRCETPCGCSSGNNPTDEGIRPEQVVYREMLFRLPAALESSLRVQEVILSLERNNNVHRIDQLMLRTAIDLLRHANNPDQRLGINISALTFSHEQHFEELIALVRGQPAPLRQRLVMEVTETAIVARPELWCLKLQRLRDLGVLIAIDDFGVGYASIAYLFRFRVDFIKLDLSFSQRLGDRNVEALVTFLLTYASQNNCQLILEGIESQEQLQSWQHQGVQLFQGYLFDREAGAGSGA